MARYIVRHSYINILGYIWTPHEVVSTYSKSLSLYDLDNMRDGNGTITRESIEHWLTTNSGDFSEVIDFSASIEDGDQSLDFPWSSESTEVQYLDTLAAKFEE